MLLFLELKHKIFSKFKYRVYIIDYRIREENYLFFKKFENINLLENMSREKIFTSFMKRVKNKVLDLNIEKE